MFDGYVFHSCLAISRAASGATSAGRVDARPRRKLSQSTAASLMEISVQFGQPGSSCWGAGATSMAVGGRRARHWALPYLGGCCCISTCAGSRGPVRAGGGVAAVVCALCRVLDRTWVDNPGGPAGRGHHGTLTVPAAVFAFCSSWLVGFAAIFVPAGLGVRELTLATLLQRMTPITPAMPRSLPSLLAWASWLPNSSSC